MNFTFLDFLVVSGLMLSLFLVILLWSSKSFRSDTHNFFALAIISLNLSLVITWLDEFVPANGILELINWQFLFPFAFLIYVMKAIKHPLGSSRSIWFFLTPCLVFSTFHVVDFTFGFDVYDWLSGGDEKQYIYLIELISFSFIVYSVALIGFSYGQIRKAKNIYVEEKKWLKFNSVSILIFCVSWLFSELGADLFDFPIWDYLLAFLGIFLAVTSYKGVHQLNIHEQRRQLEVLQLGVQKESNLFTTNKIQRKLSEKSTGKIEKLHSLMVEDCLYLNPVLTRSMIAAKLDISDGYLSELMSTSLNSNFNDYVNEFRVKHVIDMLENEKFEIFSIEAIGYESGFKSKSVFYKAFKNVTQKTPGEYRKTINLS